MIQGLIGLRSLRSNVSCVLATISSSSDQTRPLAPSAEAKGVDLLPGFCSSPLPALRRVKVGPRSSHIVIEPAGLGAASAVTCIVGRVVRGAIERGATEHRYEQHLAYVRTPCKVLIHDTLVRRGLYDSPPEVRVYSDHRDEPVTAEREIDLIPTRESVVHLGSGIDVLGTPHVPDYVAMAGYAFGCLGWDAGDFVVYRCRIEYPVMPSSVGVRFRLPRRVSSRRERGG